MIALQRFSKWLLGYDVFLSYAYADGQEYARRLEKELTNRDFSCFLDLEELAYGDALSPSLRRAIARCKLLILVGTEAVLFAPYVDLEVKAALQARTTVLPIDIGRIRQRVSDPTLRELRWLEEQHTARQTSTPSTPSHRFAPCVTRTSLPPFASITTYASRANDLSLMSGTVL